MHVVIAAEDSRTQDRLENERRAHADLGRGVREPLNVVAPGELLAGPRIAVHATATDAPSGPPDSVAVPAHDRTPRSDLDGPCVFPQPSIHIADVVDGHPDGIETGVGVGAKGEMPAQRAIDVDC